jgi:hypothetical protein
MLKHYKTLDEAITNNNFCTRNVTIVGDYIMGEHIINGKTYICHISFDNFVTIDRCIEYSKSEAIKIMTRLLLDELA